MKIVIDTNVIASAIFFGGKPRELLGMVVNQDLQAFASPEIVTEYQETVDELCTKYPGKPTRLPLTLIISAMKLVDPATRIPVSPDPDDYKFIECAVDAKCLYIVSGDKDLTSLKNYQDIQIVTVAEFLAQYNHPEL